MSHPLVKFLVAFGVGAVLGVLASKVVFVGSGLTLIVWGLAALALGAWCSPIESLLVGAAFGFAVSLVFLVTGYSGRTPLSTHLFGFAVLSAFGAFCGLVLGLVGSFLGRLIRGRRHAPSPRTAPPAH